MIYKILNKGAFSMLEVMLEQGETIKAESGAMVAMSETFDIEGKLEGGLGKALARSFLSGEKMFFQTITASRGNGTILLAPGVLGDIQAIELNGEDYIIQKDGYFASTANIEVSTKVQGLIKGLFSGEGFFLLKAGGTGLLFVSSFGNIHELELKENEKMIIDNHHLVAWKSDMNYRIKKASKSVWSSLTSGEMLVTEFVGPGKVYIQSRNPSIMMANSGA
ncbi:TIGR00266 family protein [Alkaliphilus sp. B6464]|uniref:TIGR00266 family protein n=1 Tax=Alkaliphilus sp. B6464 TaxID=2731219 RepID=UPI001BA5E0D7|nr:TIGR00266 family protein [Alkaliphilus sp. B6464]QUH21816.1 TIGR00266 family protein [Alkaliphilus sp. B6464]